MNKFSWVSSTIGLVAICLVAISAHAVANPPTPADPLTLDQAPKAPLAGQSNGEPWTPKEVQFSGTKHGWVLSITDGVSGIRRFDLPLDGIPKKGAKLTREHGVCVNDGGMIQIEEKGEARNPGAVCTYVLEITDWPKGKPHQGKDDGDQKVLGKATARIVALATDPFGDLKGPTYVAGTIKADVIYTFN